MVEQISFKDLLKKAVVLAGSNPRYEQLVIGGGDLGAIKYYSLREMDIVKLSEDIGFAPDIMFDGNGDPHRAIPDSVSATTPFQAYLSQAIQFLERFQKRPEHPIDPINQLLYRLARSGDYAFRTRLEAALRSFLDKLAPSEIHALTWAIDTHSVPLVDCGIYDIAANNRSPYEVELYIPLEHQLGVPVWLVIISGKYGKASYNITTRLTERSEAIIIREENIGTLPMETLLQFVTGGC